MTSQVSIRIIFQLLLVNFLYACSSIASKYTSFQSIGCCHFIVGIFGLILILGTYAFFWQQILKRTELSTAYMFKGSSLVFVLILSALFLGEGITLCNVIGALVIAGGIVLFAKA